MLVILFLDPNHHICFLLSLYWCHTEGKTRMFMKEASLFGCFQSYDFGKSFHRSGRKGRDPVKTISGNFALKPNGSVQSNRKSFEKIGFSFRGGPLFSAGPIQSKWTVLFDHPDPFLIPVPPCSVYNTIHT